VLREWLSGVDFRTVPDGPGEAGGSERVQDCTVAASPLLGKADLSGYTVYRPSPNALKLFYDKSQMVGLCGPAGTGKSRACLEKAHLLAEKYPGCRILLCRQTRASMTQTTLWTYETEVLPPSHECRDGLKRSHRQSYNYNNRSEVVVGGLDDVQKIMSSQYDFVYLQEAIEAGSNDVEMIMTRLRNGVIPYQQLLFDCNPTYPLHWLNQGALAGQFTMYSSHHEDNPRMWEEAPAHVQEPCEEWPAVSPDKRVGRWTAYGLDYLSKLDKLTGSRHKRLRLGKWASAEGAVHQEWDADVHMVKCASFPATWRRVWHVDFGFTNPFSWGCWAVDYDGRMHLEHEVYMTEVLLEDHVQSILDCCGWTRRIMGRLTPTRQDATPLPYAIVCDHDAEGRATLEKLLPQLRVEKAYKSISDGLQAVSSRLKPAGDGRPRLFFREGALWQVDQKLLDAKKPTCLVQEFDAYVWAQDSRKVAAQQGALKDVPADEYNHGMDGMRYAVCFEDKLVDEYKARDVVMSGAPEMSVVGVGWSNRRLEGGNLGVLEGAGYKHTVAAKRFKHVADKRRQKR
jgi:hypothetical protein